MRTKQCRENVERIKIKSLKQIENNLVSLEKIKTIVQSIHKSKDVVYVPFLLGSPKFASWKENIRIEGRKNECTNEKNKERMKMKYLPSSWKMNVSEHTKVKKTLNPPRSNTHHPASFHIFELFLNKKVTQLTWHHSTSAGWLGIG